MVKFFSICLVVLLLCSCHSRRKEIARIVEEWKNKEVIFPDPLLVKVQGRDTILPDFPATCQSLSATLPIRSAGGYAKNQPVSCRTGFPNFPARFAQPGPAYR